MPAEVKTKAGPEADPIQSRRVKTIREGVPELKLCIDGTDGELQMGLG